jgi:ribonucleoside-diphosphate reductase alpha chain
MVAMLNELTFLNDTYFLNPAHVDLYRERYALKGADGLAIESDIYETFTRVVNYIYKNDKEHAAKALRKRIEKKLIDAGRPLAQAGTDTKNLFNCFVLGFADDTREAISELKRQHFNIQAQGGGTGMNFSTLRPRGSVCKKNQSRSSGAVGFITDISYQSSNIQQGGNRSGANMGTMEDWHPDLLDFVTRKSRSNWENVRKFAAITNEDDFSYFQWDNHYQWQQFNVSVMLSDKFIEAVMEDSKDPWQLQWRGTRWYLWRFENTVGPKSGKEHHREIVVTAPDETTARYKASSQVPFFNNKNMKLVEGPYDLTAKQWYRLICQNAWEDGCPGVIFIDLARRFHNGEYFNPLSSTNPCAEQFLPVNSVCCLASVVLPSFWKDGKFDWVDFKDTIHEAVRGLDNMTELNETGEVGIDANTRRERRIGLGTIGMAELLILAGKKYSSHEGREFARQVLKFLRDESYKASIELAIERNPFPGFDFEGFSKSYFFKSLPADIQGQIKQHGIRNVTVLTQAPTGTTGTITGYSQGCEPYYYMYLVRNSRVGTFADGSPAFRKWLADNNINYADFDYNVSNLRAATKLPDYFEEAHEISWEDHLKMQAVFASFVDSSVSKTINLPADATVEDVERAYLLAYQLGIKSTTIYRDGSKQQILESASKKAGASRPPTITPNHAPRRPEALECDIHHTSVKGEKWTVLVGLLNDKPYEVFCAPQEAFEIGAKYKKGTIRKNGGGKYNLELEDLTLKNISKLLQTDEHRALTRMLSISLRHGVPVSFIRSQLEKSEGTVVDFSKAVSRVLGKYKDDFSSTMKRTCTNCGSSNILAKAGCDECLDCNFQKCS